MSRDAEGWNFISYDPKTGVLPSKCPICGNNLLRMRCLSNPRQTQQLFERDIECDSCFAPLLLKINLKTAKIEVITNIIHEDTQER